MLLLKRNGYVLEQLYSPLIVQTTPEHQELKAIANECITRHHTFHYLGLAKSQWGLFEKEQPPRLKPLLYVYRSLLTGIYLMQTGKIEANLTKLNQVFQLPYIAELITLKQTGEEKSTLTEINLSFYQQEYARLKNELELAYNQTQLRDQPIDTPGTKGLGFLLRRTHLL